MLLVWVAVVCATANSQGGASERESRGGDGVAASGGEYAACTVVVSPSAEDADGGDGFWWLESGVPGHWSSGLSVPVFESDFVNIVVMADNCEVACMHMPCVCICACIC